VHNGQPDGLRRRARGCAEVVAFDVWIVQPQDLERDPTSPELDATVPEVLPPLY